MENKQNYIMPVMAATLGFFMALLDTTIVNVSLPKITAYYETSMDQISWIIDSYNIAFGVTLLTAVRLADQFGRKRIFQIGLITFIIASLLCGLSQSVDFLVTFRAIQGLAAALIVPVCIPLVLVHTPTEKVGNVTALFGIMAGVSTALGPTIGGIISEHFAWQWIFYINIPIGLIAIGLIHSFVKESYDSTASKQIDWAGMISISIALFTLIYGLLQVKEYGWSSLLVLSCLACSSIALLLFIIFELRSNNPMLPIRLLKNYQFASGNIALLCLGIGMMCVYFLMAFYLTSVKELSQMKAGLILSSSSIATILITPFAAKANTLGTKWFGVIGYLLFGIGTFLLSCIELDHSIWVIVGIMLIIGLGSGLIFSPLSIALILQVPKEKEGIASGLFQISRVIGAALGVALSVVLLQQMMDGEVKSAKNEMIELVNASELNTENKEKIKLQIETYKESNQKSKSELSLQNLVDKLSTEENRILAASPKHEQQKVKNQFASEKNTVIDLYTMLEGKMKNHVSSAFKSVFRIESLVLFLGAIFAYFNGINAIKMKKYLSDRNFANTN